MENVNRPAMSENAHRPAMSENVDRPAMSENAHRAVMQENVHRPVMPEEVVSYLNIHPSGIYLDMTIGAGGHAKKIAEKLDQTGCLIGIDRDAEILPYAIKSLDGVKAKYTIQRSPFASAPSVLRSLSVGRIQGVLFDLGVSSYQLEQPGRGFSFTLEGPLDMRMDTTAHTKACDIVNYYTEEALANLIFEFGEERHSRRIAKWIVRARKQKPIQSTLELANLIARESGYAYGRIHPATRVFQALRIAVNDELGQLQQAMESILPYIAPEGRIVVICFHSLEDRIAKQFFKSNKNALKILTPKPILPTREEQRTNPRSRSAKLRCAEKKSELQDAL